MKGLVVPEALDLIEALPLQQDGPDRELLVAALLRGLREDGPGELRQAEGEFLYDLRHLSLQTDA